MCAETATKTPTEAPAAPTDEEQMSALLSGNVADAATGSDDKAPAADGIGLLDELTDPEAPDATAAKTGDTSKEEEQPAAEDLEAADPEDEGDTPADEKSGDEETGTVQPTVPHALRERALAIGLDDEGINALADSGLEKTVAAMESRIGKSGDEKPADATGTAKEEKEEDVFEIKLDPETVEPEVVQAFKGLHEYYQGKIKGLEENVRGVIEHLETASDQQAVKSLDIELVRLKQPDLFGEGPTMALKQDSPEFKQRIQFLQYTRRMGKALGEKALTMTDAELVDAAYASFYSGRAKSTTEKEIGKTMRTRKNAGVPRGAHKDSSGPPPTGDDAAEKTIAAFIKKHE